MVFRVGGNSFKDCAEKTARILYRRTLPASRIEERCVTQTGAIDATRVRPTLPPPVHPESARYRQGKPAHSDIGRPDRRSRPWRQSHAARALLSPEARTATERRAHRCRNA